MKVDGGMANGSSTPRFNQRHKGASACWGLKRQAGGRAPEQHYHRILMWSTKAHLHAVAAVISIPMEEENQICDANSAGVLVRRAAGTMSRSVFRTQV